jgi:hypothetical protein
MKTCEIMERKSEKKIKGKKLKGMNKKDRNRKGEKYKKG